MANATGFNEAKVNDCISEYNSQAKNVLKSVTKGFNDVLDALADNWGTQEGVTFVTDKFVPDLQKTGQQVADTIQQIGNVIKTTGEQQAADTKNSVSINAPTKPELGELKNKMKEKLSNGFVGVYDDLKAKVSASHNELVKDLDAALGKMQTQIQGKTDKAFQESGKADQVSAQIVTFIQDIKTAIDAAFATLQTNIDTFTADADTYAHTIQQAGLRSGATS